MKLERAFCLRHPQGFSEARFAWFKVGCSAWRGYVLGLVECWELLFGDAAPEYHVGLPSLSADRLVATLPLGGNLNYGHLKRLEDGIPPELHRSLPVWFIADLEESYINPQMGFPTPKWQSVLTADERSALISSHSYEWSLKYQMK